MKKCLTILLSICACLNIAGQEHYVFENRFRNPVDTMTFYTQPTILLFVHSECGHEHWCPTTRMQKALEEDSLQIRKALGIKLYVAYPTSYNTNDINTFDAFNPKNSEVVFYTDIKYKGVFSEGNQTPFVVLYDKKGDVHRWQGGTYKDLVDWISIYIPIPCSFCKGTGSVKPVPERGNPDWCVGICPKCGGSGRSFRKK